MTANSMTPFTMLDDGQLYEFAASVEGETIRLESKRVLGALGWTQKPEGLCRGDVCIPIAGRPNLITDQGIDPVELADALGRPIAVDLAESVVSFGAETAAHGSELKSGIAPDFTLPDLTGKEYSLASFKGKKVLLIAYASW